MKFWLLFFAATISGSAQDLMIFLKETSPIETRVGSFKVLGSNLRCLAIDEVPVGWSLSLTNSGNGTLVIEGNVQYGAAAIPVTKLFAALRLRKIDPHEAVEVKLRMELLDSRTGDFLPDRDFAVTLTDKAMTETKPRESETPARPKK